MLDRLVPGLLLLTGATGLIYQVVLGRLLALHLGSSGASLAMTLAAFLGGMALGAIVAGRAAAGALRRVGQPATVYALLEAGIGLWMLAFPAIADGLFGAFFAATMGADPTSVGYLAGKLAVAGVLVLPLSTAMGATLPVLAAGVERVEPTRGVLLVSRYYFVNAAGAALGALIAGFWWIESFGLELPLTMAAAVNLAVGLIAWRAFRGVSDGTERSPAATETAGLAGRTPGTLLLAAFLTGAVALTFEVVWTRLEGLLLGASVYSFAAMLVVVIAGISVGSALAARTIAAGSEPRRVLGATQWLAGLATLLLVSRLGELPVELLDMRSRLVPASENYGVWLWLGGGWLAAHLLPGALCLGAAFPALLAAASRDGARTDRATASLLGSNTLGNLTGAMTAGFVVMPALGLEYTLTAGAVVSLGVAVLVAPRPWQARDWGPPASIAALALVYFAAVPVSAEPVQWGMFRMRPATPSDVDYQVRSLAAGTTIFRQDGKDASISVVRYPNDHLAFRTNGKTDGSTGDVTTQVMLGHLGLLFRPEAKDVLIVGLGTGQTAAAVASHPQTSITVAELSPAVVEVARLFGPYNGRVLEEPRLRVVVTDAREVLRTLPDESLDLVVSEPSNPWVVGVADLYTDEHFERLRQRLRPGGILVQWIHSYELSDGLLGEILCTLSGRFDEIAVFRMDEGDLALVAAKGALQFDPERARAVLAEPGVRAELVGHKRRSVPADLDTFLATQLCGPATVQRICQGFQRPLSERFPRVEYQAPRDFFAGLKADELVRTLDTRIGQPPDTFLAQLMAQQPLDAARREHLHAFFAASRHETERPLVAATAPPGGLPVDLSAVIDAVPEPARVPESARKRWCHQLQTSAPWMLDRQETQFGPVSGSRDLLGWQDLCAKVGRRKPPAVDGVPQADGVDEPGSVSPDQVPPSAAAGI